jgi:glutathione S-transferase
MTPPTLLTIPVSHYCEKVRWAFERAGVAFREEGHLPVFNRLAGLRYGAWNSVPLLVTAEGLLRDSADILRWIDARTAPDRRLRPDDPTTQADVAAWERLADAELGPATRRIGYAWVLPDRELALRVSSHGVPALEVLLLRWSFPLVRYGMARELQIDPPHLASATRGCVSGRSCGRALVTCWPGSRSTRSWCWWGRRRGTGRRTREVGSWRGAVWTWLRT